jgi:integrase/recombinase XerD
MKINRFGKAEVLTPDQINLLFNEGFVKPRDLALFGVCATFNLTKALKQQHLE